MFIKRLILPCSVALCLMPGAFAVCKNMDIRQANVPGWKVSEPTEMKGNVSGKAHAFSRPDASAVLLSYEYTNPAFEAPTLEAELQRLVEKALQDWGRQKPNARIEGPYRTPGNPAIGSHLAKLGALLVINDPEETLVVLITLGQADKCYNNLIYVAKANSIADEDLNSALQRGSQLGAALKPLLGVEKSN